MFVRFVRLFYVNMVLVISVDTLSEGRFSVKKERFRKKPVVIEAYQTDVELIINTLEGDMKASPGDWIITGVNNEQYPCKPDIFERTYEKVIAE